MVLCRPGNCFCLFTGLLSIVKLASHGSQLWDSNLVHLPSFPTVPCPLLPRLLARIVSHLVLCLDHLGWSTVHSLANNSIRPRHPRVALRPAPGLYDLRRDLVIRRYLLDLGCSFFTELQINYTESWLNYR